MTLKATFTAIHESHTFNTNRITGMFFVCLFVFWGKWCHRKKKKKKKKTGDLLPQVKCRVGSKKFKYIYFLMKY